MIITNPRQRSILEDVPTVIDLFGGPGALGTGIGTAFDVSVAVEWDHWASQTYQVNHPNTKVMTMDVIDVDYRKGDFDGVIGVAGGPPCQDFSAMNLHRDPNSTRANMVYEMVRAAEEIRPHWVIVENTLSIPKGHRHKVAKDLQALGYSVVHRIIKSLDYGSVQYRQRWILVAHKTKHVFPDPPRRLPTRTASEILLPDTIPERRVEAATKGRKAIFAKIRRKLKSDSSLRGHWLDRDGNYGPGSKFDQIWVMDPDKHMTTVLNPGKLYYFEPKMERYLSNAEFAMAIGLPHDYYWVGTQTDIGQQIANCVPVEMAAVFANALAEVEYPRIGKNPPPLLEKESR